MNPLESLDLEGLSKLSPPVLLMLFLNLVGYGLNKNPYVENKFIPVILFILGGILYPFIGILDATQRHPHVHLGIIGMIIGGAAVGANQILRQFKTSNNENENKPENTPKP